MDKINELKEKLAKDHAGSNYVKNHEPRLHSHRLRSFEAGFNAAMELQLPVLFAEWWEKEWQNTEVADIKEWERVEQMSIKERYDYWLENVYQPLKP